MRNQSPSILRAKHLVGGILACLIMSPASFAQSESFVLDEITVTATKRTESLHDVPISIGVVSGDLINKFDIKDLTELENFMPSLTVHSTFGNYAVRIRGLGSGVTNLAFDSSVSVFNDGVYCGRSKCLESAFLDVERIEVARGPQGALFGKSTIAGAISVISAKPTQEFEGYIRAGVEMDDGGYTLNGVISGPLSDTFRGRLAVKYDNLDGWVDNTLTSGDDAATQSSVIRASFAWDASDSTEFNLKIESGENDSEGRSNQLVSPGLFGGNTSDPTPEFVSDDVRRVSTGVGPVDFLEADYSMATLSMDTDVAGHTITAIAGYWEYDQRWFLDVDGVPEFFLNTTLEDEYDQTSFEVRLLSPTESSIEYIVGAWYQETDTRTRQYSPFANLFFQTLGLPPFLIAPSPNGMDRNFMRDGEAISLYGQVTWKINDRLRVIGDLRYTDEEQDGTGFAFPALFPDNINPVYTPVPPGYAGWNAEYRFTQTRKDDSVDPSIRVQYDINDEITGYVAYSEGSKSGGLIANDSTLGDQMLAVGDPAFYDTYVGQSTVTPADMIAGLTLAQGNHIFDYEDEEADNIEIGAKMSLLDGRANLSMALFSMQFDNLQTSSYDGTRFIIGNAASAEVEGFELEGTVLATDSLQLTASMAYIDATYSDYAAGQCPVGPGNVQIDPACVDGQANLDGLQLERTPEWEFNVAADWDTQLTASTMLFANLSVHYSDEYFVRVDYAPNGLQDSFTKWNARIAIAAEDDTWEVALIGRNLSDEHTIQHAYEIAGSEFVSLTRGRSTTIEGVYRF